MYKEIFNECSLEHICNKKKENFKDQWMMDAY